MADQTFPAFIDSRTSAGTLLDADRVAVVRAGVTYRSTMAEVATYIASALAATAVAFGSINVANADTTITRVSAGRIAVEGSNVLMASDVGSVVQAYDADLTAWAGVNPSSYSTTSQIAAAYQPLDSGLTALAAFNTDGLIVQTAANTYAGRTLTGTAAEITVTNGTGVAGNPTLSLPTALTFTGKTITGGTFASPTLSGTVAGAATWSGIQTHSAAIKMDATTAGIQFSNSGTVIWATGIRTDLTGTNDWVINRNGVANALRFDTTTLAATFAARTAAPQFGGNDLGSMADDSATSVQMSASSFGMVMIRTSGTEWAILAFDFVGTPGISIMQASADFAVTGGVLSGTTGTDAKFNVSVHTDNKIYFENRIGSTRLVSAHVFA